MKDGKLCIIVDSKSAFLSIYAHNRCIPQEKRLFDIQFRMSIIAGFPSTPELERKILLHFIKRELKRYEKDERYPASAE